MNKKHDTLDRLWDNLLSRQPDLIRAAFASLDPADQNAVLAHLHRMVSEAGWQPGQRTSAKAAEKALSIHSNQDK
ncbi:MAG: hypothetical protein A2Z71_00405 [Chloroflexi bacterium RBG_13_50_21]|nr:MAG: hypothetical protein A2Z71_00405 [Chloroflexi bacterium RBG_13_50_21]